MRRVLFSTIALVALIFTSCELQPNNDNGDLNTKAEFHILSDNVIGMLSDGGNVEIKYVIDTVVEGATLTATSETEWIKDIEVNDSVTFYVEENYSIADRLGAITLTYANTTITVEIDQWGRTMNNNAVLAITSERSMTFDANGGNGTITYSLTGGDEFDKPLAIGNQEWIKDIEVENDVINFVVESNTTQSIRRGNITVSYGTYNFPIQIKQDAPLNTLKLETNSSTIKLGESIYFTATYANEDVTASTTIYDYYTNNEIPNPYTPAEIAERVFFAKYNGNSSSLLTIKVVPSDTPDLPNDIAPDSYDFNQRMLIIDHTGSGCPNCPDVKEVFKDAEEDANYKDRFNPVFSYSFSSSELCYSSAAKTLWNYYKMVCESGDKLTGFPSFTTNYCFNYTGKFNLKQRIDDLWDENTTASIALSTKLDGNKLVVNAAVKSSKSQSIKLSLWLLEDDIYEKQSGYAASWMHTHHNVMRDALTGVSSSDISGIDFGYVSEYTTYERVLTYDLFVSNKWNINNCKLIAIISAPNSNYDGKYEVVNTAICDLNSSIGFDYKK